MRTVAGAEPSTEITGLADRHTSKMGTDAQHYQPFGLLDTVFIWLGISQSLPFRVLCFFDLGRCSVADEDGLASPFDNHILALGDRRQINLDLGLSKDIGGSGHVNEEVLNSRLRAHRRQSTHRASHEVLEHLIRSLPPLAHICAKVGYLSRIALRVLEGALEARRVVGPGRIVCPSSLLLAGDDRRGRYGGGQPRSGTLSDQRGG